MTMHRTQSELSMLLQIALQWSRKARGKDVTQARVEREMGFHFSSFMRARR